MRTILESLAHALRGESLIGIRIYAEPTKNPPPLPQPIPSADQEALLRSVVVFEDSDDERWPGFQNGRVPGDESQASVHVLAWSETWVFRSTAVDGVWGWDLMPRNPHPDFAPDKSLAEAIRSAQEAG